MNYSNNSQRLRIPKLKPACIYCLSDSVQFPVYLHAPDGFLAYTSTYSTKNEINELRRAVADAHTSDVPFALVGNRSRIAIYRQKMRNDQDVQRAARRTETAIQPNNWTRNTR